MALATEQPLLAATVEPEVPIQMGRSFGGYSSGSGRGGSGSEGGGSY